MMRNVVRISVTALLIVGCGNSFRVDDYASPEDLLDASREEFRRGNCGGAIQGLRGVLSQLSPGDLRAVQARFLLAECHFKHREYLEASRQFRRVSDEFPSHELAPRALLRSGDALARLWQSPQLDPTYGENALATYRELVTRYPSSEVAEVGRARSLALMEKFARKEFKTGEFYMRLRAYDSAIIYFKSVVANYAQSSYAPLALLRLVEAYRRISYEEERREICAYLWRFHPDAVGVQEACPRA